MNNAVYEDIYLKYHDRVFSYIKARVNGHHEAQDLTADVFVKVLNSFDSFDSEKAELSTWIYTIASNTIRDHIRRVGVRMKHGCDVSEEHLEVLASEDDNCADGLLKEETLSLLAAALEKLSERERMIVVMHFYKGVSHKEISVHLNLSYSNVRYISSQAVEKIRKFFKEHNYIY